jgi:hypothetical protein
VQNPPPLTREPTRLPWTLRGSEVESSNLAPKIINPKEPRHHRTRSFRESLTPLLRLFPTTCRRRRESGPPSSPFDGDLSWTNRPVGQDESCSLLAASQAHNLLFVTINQPQTAVRCRVLCGSFWALLGMLPNQPGLVVRCLSSDADSPRRYYSTLLYYTPGSCGSFESAGTAAGPSASRWHGLPMQCRSPR